MAAGLAAPAETLEPDEIEARFTPIRQVVIERATGAVTDVDPAGFDPRAAAADPDRSEAAPPNNAGLQRVADRALVYELRDDGGELDLVVLPVHGLGLWGILYGFVALDADLETIRGLTYYEHKETPGLGGEVDNPRWKSLWDGRKAFGPDGAPGHRGDQGAGRAARGRPVPGGRAGRGHHDEPRRHQHAAFLARRAGLRPLPGGTPHAEGRLMAKTRAAPRRRPPADAA